MKLFEKYLTVESRLLFWQKTPSHLLDRVLSKTLTCITQTHTKKDDQSVFTKKKDIVMKLKTKKDIINKT